jgi:putative transposase
VVEECPEVLGVSRSGYTPGEGGLDETNAKLAETIRRLYEESRRLYGSPRIHAALRRRGIACGRHRVVREEGIRSKTRRRFRYIATKRQETPAAPNRLGRSFTAARPNQVCASDITLVKTVEGWLHLAIVLDLYSRKIVGWATSPAVTQALALEALAMALAGTCYLGRRAVVCTQYSSARSFDLIAGERATIRQPRPRSTCGEDRRPEVSR